MNPPGGVSRAPPNTVAKGQVVSELPALPVPEPPPRQLPDMGPCVPVYLQHPQTPAPASTSPGGSRNEGWNPQGGEQAGLA